MIKPLRGDLVHYLVDGDDGLECLTAIVILVDGYQDPVHTTDRWLIGHVNLLVYSYRTDTYGRVHGVFQDEPRECANTWHWPHDDTDPFAGCLLGLTK